MEQAHEVGVPPQLRPKLQVDNAVCLFRSSPASVSPCIDELDLASLRPN